MRRRSDDFINATHILKVAGLSKPNRTKILEREVILGTHEKIQGGYGKIPKDAGRELAIRFRVLEGVLPLLEFNPDVDKLGPRPPRPRLIRRTKAEMAAQQALKAVRRAEAAARSRSRGRAKYYAAVTPPGSKDSPSYPYPIPPDGALSAAIVAAPDDDDDDDDLVYDQDLDDDLDDDDDGNVDASGHYDPHPNGLPHAAGPAADSDPADPHASGGHTAAVAARRASVFLGIRVQRPRSRKQLTSAIVSDDDDNDNDNDNDDDDDDDDYNNNTNQAADAALAHAQAAHAARHAVEYVTDPASALDTTTADQHTAYSSWLEAPLGVIRIDDDEDGDYVPDLPWSDLPSPARGPSPNDAGLSDPAADSASFTDPSLSHGGGYGYGNARYPAIDGDADPDGLSRPHRSSTAGSADPQIHHLQHHHIPSNNELPQHRPSRPASRRTLPDNDDMDQSVVMQRTPAPTRPVTPAQAHAHAHAPMTAPPTVARPIAGLKIKRLGAVSNPSSQSSALAAAQPAAASSPAIAPSAAPGSPSAQDSYANRRPTISAIPELSGPAAAASARRRASSRAASAVHRTLFDHNDAMVEDVGGMQDSADAPFGDPDSLWDEFMGGDAAAAEAAAGRNRRAGTLAPIHRPRRTASRRGHPVAPRVSRNPWPGLADHVRLLAPAASMPRYVACTAPAERRRRILVAMAAQPDEFVADLVDYMRDPACPTGIDVGMRLDDLGNTPLHWAAAFGRVHIVHVLLGLGADPSCTAADGATPLMRAVSASSAYSHNAFPDLFHLLRASVFECDKDSRTALHCIAGLSRSRSSRRIAHYYAYYLLQYLESLRSATRARKPREAAMAAVAAAPVEPFLNRIDASGNTALHLAVKLRDCRLAHMLLRAGADPDVLDTLGDTPADIAQALPTMSAVFAREHFVDALLLDSLSDAPNSPVSQAPLSPRMPAFEEDRAMDVLERLQQTCPFTLSESAYRHVMHSDAPLVASALHGARFDVAELARSQTSLERVLAEAAAVFDALDASAASAASNAAASSRKTSASASTSTSASTSAGLATTSRLSVRYHRADTPALRDMAASLAATAVSRLDSFAAIASSLRRVPDVQVAAHATEQHGATVQADADAAAILVSAALASMQVSTAAPRIDACSTLEKRQISVDAVQPVPKRMRLEETAGSLGGADAALAHLGSAAGDGAVTPAAMANHDASRDTEPSDLMQANAAALIDAANLTSSVSTGGISPAPASSSTSVASSPSSMSSQSTSSSSSSSPVTAAPIVTRRAAQAVTAMKQRLDMLRSRVAQSEAGLVGLRREFAGMAAARRGKDAHFVAAIAGLVELA
ncbi:Transcription factor mbp1 [Polyrhizophydium stewartii]|uniref:Transcription factor mbp1 n=1 Tax=Polyrhizophydium stewartii TaxID=2732419 RepID=A0ABR4NA07_9FUNG